MDDENVEHGCERGERCYTGFGGGAMGRLILFCLVVATSTDLVWAQRSHDPNEALMNRSPDSRMVFGAGASLLAAGSEALRYGRYDDGIRLTLMA